MTRKTLERTADALLDLYENDPDRPTWSEHRLLKRIVCGKARDSQLDPLRRKHPDDPLLRAELDGLVGSAMLSPSQLHLLRSRIAGWAFADIARSRGVTKQAVRNAFLRAIKKIVSASHVYPYKGLSEVYRAETRHRPAKGWVW